MNSNINLKPLSGKMFKEIEQVFFKVSEYKYFTIEEFFISLNSITMLTVQEGIEYFNELQRSFGFSDAEGFKEFSIAHVNFYNGIVSLLEKIEEMEFNDAIEYLDDISKALVSVFNFDKDKDRIHEYLDNHANSAIADYLCINGIYMDEISNEQEFMEIISGLAEEDSNYPFDLFNILMAYPIKIIEGVLPADEENVRLVFKAIIIMYSRINLLRKSNLPSILLDDNDFSQSYPDNTVKVNFKNKKVKRNDPCPCGSGKKYKKCCMDNDIRQ